MNKQQIREIVMGSLEHYEDNLSVEKNNPRWQLVNSTRVDLLKDLLKDFESGGDKPLRGNKEKVKMLTSDRIVSISLAPQFDMPGLEMLNIQTEKGMTLLVDKNRWGDLRVGDQINIGLEGVGQ